MHLVSFLIALGAATSLVSASPGQFIRREASGNYPEINVTPPASSLPQAWVDAYNKAKAAGKIPSIPLSAADGTYPDGGKPSYCSWTLSKCFGPTDIQSAPPGEWAINFDDGPTQASTELISFLQQQNQSATHFMIGSQMKAFPDAVKQAVAQNHEIGVHTWSHTPLTTVDDMGVVGELGWNMQIIYDLTGFVAKSYRPPQGSADARVRAIATEVFGLTAVYWTLETNDWCLQDDGTTACTDRTPGKDRTSVDAAIQEALKGDKSKGVVPLEHELRQTTLDVFQAYWSQVKEMGWTPKAVGDLGAGSSWYANAKNSLASPDGSENLFSASSSGSGTASGSSSSTGSSTSTGSGSSSSTGSSTSAGSGSSAGSSDTSGSTAGSTSAAGTGTASGTTEAAGTTTGNRTTGSASTATNGASSAAAKTSGADAQLGAHHTMLAGAGILAGAVALL